MLPNNQTQNITFTKIENTMIPIVKFGHPSSEVTHQIVFTDQLDDIKSRGNELIKQKIASKIDRNFAQINTLVDALEIQFIYYSGQNNGVEDQQLEDIRKKAAAITLKADTQVALLSSEALNVAFLEGLVLGNYQFDKISKKDAEKIVHIFVPDEQKELLEPVLKVLEEVAWARDLINKPLSHLTAEKLAQEIYDRGTPLGMEVEIFGKKKLETLKMGGILAVNKGSIDPPTMTVASYKPENAINDRPYVLVGKGVVYDTGGMSLKPTPNSMDIMKSDMGGAACVAATMMAVVKLKLPIYMIALVPATDNRPGQNAYVPRDVIEMFDGTTVEVLNTDAEGRMILADALAYAKKYKPQLLIDAATLTGAAVRAIGQNAIVAMGNADEKYFTQLTNEGNHKYERIARMPFWDDYKEELESDVADLRNIGSPLAGQITAGKFLEHFTDYPYIHLDIAGPTFIARKKGYLTKGGTGFGVRILTSFFQKMTTSNE